ncbi:MAG: PorP/SprF family type IX secretion system membrane protein [Bacteroidota bacterium]
MKTQFSIYFWALLMVFASANAYAQTPFYGQMFANRLQLNPALAGSQGAGYAMAQYRNQWSNGTAIYQYLGLAYDQSIAKTWGVGINTQYDLSVAGFTVSNHHLHIAKAFQMGEKHFLRAGLSGGLNLRSINYNKLRFPDQIDPNTGMITPSPTSGFDHFSLADFNAGLLYYNRLFFLSTSARHVQGGLFVETGAPALIREYLLTSGLRIPISLGSIGDFSLSPLVHYQREGTSNVYMLGLAVETAKVQLITWLMPETSLSLGLGTTLGPCQLAYQYEHYLSDDPFGNFGPTHEFSLGFLLGEGDKRQLSAMPKF